MSPRTALQSPVFLFYLALAAGLLVLAGALFGVLRWGLGKKVDDAWAAYRGWLLIVPLLCLCFFLGREAIIIFVTIVAVFGFREFARASGLDRHKTMTAAVYLGISATGVVSLITDPNNRNPGWYGLFMALPVFVIAMIVVIPVIRNRAEGQLQSLALAIVAFLYFGWMFGHLAFLANSAQAYSYLGFLVVAVELSDVAAFVFGKMFGRTLLCSNVSPKKTWEGAAGALAVSLLLPWALRFSFPQFEVRDCLIAGLIVGIGSQLGDLVVSGFKRDLGIKDLGWIIPGHGGILDRIDSLIYVSPLFFHYLRYRFDLNLPY